MKNKQGQLIIKHFESPNRKNEYLLISGNEAATSDVSSADEPVSRFQKIHLLADSRPTRLRSAMRAGRMERSKTLTLVT